MKSCTGKVLRVDLSSGSVKTEKIPDSVYENVLSGKGLAAWYLCKNIPAGADPLGPDNILCFASGALTGTGALLSGRWTVACKSPLTGGWGDANCGGIFSPAIKQCGYDAIFISGISEKPVYLYCDNTTVEIRDASQYWGLDAVEAEKKFHEDLDPVCKKRPCIALIGPAAEKLSLISGICNEYGRIAARSGVGAVAGSKKLKAVVLAGSKPMPCADRDAVKALSKTLGQKITKMSLPGHLGFSLGIGGAMLGKMPSVPLDGAMTTLIFREWGTPSNTPMAIPSGDGPIKNWSAGPAAAKGFVAAFNPDKINKIEKVKYHCYSCPIGCGGKLNIKKNSYSAYDETHKPEYETLEAFGPLLLNSSLESVLALNEILNRAGVDSISAGNTIAWAFECYEKGIITKEQTGGLELNWGDTDAVIKLTEMLVRREGFGNELADGVKRASEKFGGKEFAMHVGGQEPGMHDTRNDPQLAIHMAAEPAPGKHTIGMAIQYGAMSLCDICSWAPPAKIHSKKDDLVPSDELAMVAKANACYSMLIDAVGGCYYAEMAGAHMWKVVDYLNAAAGWTHNGDHYMEIGERIQTLRQLFNIIQGYDPAAVVLPKRMEGDPPLADGPLKGVKLRNREQISLHWKAFGWDEKTGSPLPETLEKLGINALLEVNPE